MGQLPLLSGTMLSSFCSNGPAFVNWNHAQQFLQQWASFLCYLEPCSAVSAAMGQLLLTGTMLSSFCSNGPASSVNWNHAQWFLPSMGQLSLLTGTMLSGFCSNGPASSEVIFPFLWHQQVTPSQMFRC